MRPNEFLTSLGSLANQSELARLKKHLQGTGSELTPEEGASLSQTVKNVVRNAPHMKNVKLHVRPNVGHGGALAFPGRGEVHLAPRMVKNPTVVAHELGHVESARESSGGLYKPVQDTARTIYGTIVKHPWLTIAGPIAATYLLLKNNAMRKKVLNALTGVSAAASIPVILEEAQASRKALQNVPEKTRNTKVLASGLKSYAWEAAKPVAAFQLAKLLAR